MVAFLSYRWGISGPEKAKRPVRGEAHTAGERQTWIHRPCFTSSWCLLGTILVPGRQSLPGVPPLCTSACPHQPFHHKCRGAPVSWEKGGPQVRCDAWERGRSLPPVLWELCSSQDPGDMVPHQPRNSNNGPWFYSYEMLFFLYVFPSFISWLDFSISILSLSHSSIPLTVARTFCHSSGHNFTVRKPWGTPTVCDLKPNLSSAFKVRDRWVLLIL